MKALFLSILAPIVAVTCQAQHTQIYVALLFPDIEVTIVQQESHALGIRKNYHGEKFHYYFGAAWSEFDVRSQAERQCRINGFMSAREKPLTITIN